MSALLVTMGGYAGSEGDTTELSSYADAYAAVDFLEYLYGIPRDKIVIHGVSIGGALVCAAAVSRPGIHCTLDQTFLSAELMAGNSASLVSPLLPAWVASSVTAKCFPTERADPRFPGMLTDGYNNEMKAAQIRGHFFVLWARDDHMMPESFAERLIQSHYEAVIDRCRRPEHVAGLSDKELKTMMTKLCGSQRAMPASSRSNRAKLEEAVISAAQEAKLGTFSKHFSASMAGEHGSFFGEDPRTSKTYYNYLKMIGCLEVQPPIDIRGKTGKFMLYKTHKRFETKLR